MTLVRLVSLVGVALLVLVLNVAMSILYMVVYSYLINRGQPPEYYKQHIQVAAPYCSIVAGVPLMFLAGLWVASWGNGQAGTTAAVVVWLAYAIIDLGVLLAAGMTTKIAILFTVSFLTKLAGAYAGALVGLRGTSPAGAGAAG